MGNCFCCYFRQLYIALAFRKFKKDFDVLSNILVQDFCPPQTEIVRFSIGFGLSNVLCRILA